MPSDQYLPKDKGVNLNSENATNLTKEFIQEQIHSFSKVGKKYVICIDGLAGTGKSTLGKSLSSTLSIPHISSGIFYRVFTYILCKNHLVFNHFNIQKVKEGISFKVSSNQLKVYYENELVPLDLLRNKVIDGQLNLFSTDVFFRQQVSQTLVKMTTSLSSSFILDLRGSNPEYVSVLENDNCTVIRLALITDLETKVNRRILEYKLADNELEKSKIRTDISLRDSQDIASIIKTNIGLISKDTGKIDTSKISSTEVELISLNYLYKRLTRDE
jgi:cytidylate kinase